jgi:hypothetical protein
MKPLSVDVTTLVISVLSSSALSALIAGVFAIRSKNTDYRNEYFKLVLRRRITAYEKVEALVPGIKTAVLDVDHRPYHLAFSSNESRIEFYVRVMDVLSTALWITDDLFGVIRRLNILVFENTSEHESPVEFGKAHYEEIGKLRVEIEKLVARDMKTLHRIQRFLRSKRPANAYTPVAAPKPTNLLQPPPTEANHPGDGSQ